MATRAKCKCGKVLILQDQHFGKHIVCPGCSKRILVPARKTPSSSSEANDSSQASKAQPRPAARKRASQSTSCPACNKPFPESQVVCKNCQYSRRLKKRIKVRDRSEQEARPKKTQGKKAAKKKRESLLVGDGSWGLDWGQVAVGLLMILGGATWLVLGLLAGVFFFYPVILICLGILAAGKGLLGVY